MTDPTTGAQTSPEIEEIERTENEPVKLHRSRRPPAEPAQVYSIRIPVDSIGDIRRLATRRGVAPSAMMRSWILDRLQEELGGAVVEGVQGPARRKAAKANFVMGRTAPAIPLSTASARHDNAQLRKFWKAHISLMRIPS